MTNPNPNHMIEYCGDVLPHMLTTACGVESDLALRIGQDIRRRAEALATIAQTHGLAGAHRKLAQTITGQHPTA